MIDLYVLNGCPFCVKVEKYLKEEDMSYNRKEITDEDTRSKLMELTNGKTQVPFLDDHENDVMMHESDDIINYLSSKYGQNSESKN